MELFIRTLDKKIILTFCNGRKQINLTKDNTLVRILEEKEDIDEDQLLIDYDINEKLTEFLSYYPIHKQHKFLRNQNQNQNQNQPIEQHKQKKHQHQI